MAKLLRLASTWLFALGCVTKVSAEVGNITLEQQLSTQIQSLIEQTIRYRYPQQYQLDIQVRFSRAIHQLPQCSESVEVTHRSKIKLGKQKWSVRCEPERWTLSATSTSTITVWTATANKALKKGQRLTHDDIAIEPIKLYKDQKVFFKANEIAGSKIKRSVNKGDLLTTSSMYLDYDVEKGHSVDVVFQSKTIRLETLGIALESGLIGDTVSVKNQQSGKLLRGVVIEKNRVRVY